jgi:hypothetical protein
MFSSGLCTCSLVYQLLFGCFSISPVFLTPFILLWTVNKFSTCARVRVQTTQILDTS